MRELQVGAGVSQVQVLREAVAAVSLAPALASGESLPELVTSFTESGDDQISQVLLQALEVLSEEHNTHTLFIICMFTVMLIKLLNLKT